MVVVPVGFQQDAWNKVIGADSQPRSSVNPRHMVFSSNRGVTFREVNTPKAHIDTQGFLKEPKFRGRKKHSHTVRALKDMLEREKDKQKLKRTDVMDDAGDTLSLDVTSVSTGVGRKKRQKTKAKSTIGGKVKKTKRKP